MAIYNQSEVTVTFPRLMRKLNVSDFVYGGATMTYFKPRSSSNMFLASGQPLPTNQWTPASALENGNVWIMASSTAINSAVQVQWSNNSTTDYTLYAIPCPEYVGKEMVGCGSEAKVLDDIFPDMPQQFKKNLVVTALPSNWEIKYNGNTVAVGDTISVGENLTAKYNGSESDNITPESFIEYTIGTAGDYQGLAGKIRIKALKANATASLTIRGTSLWTGLRGTRFFIDSGIGSAVPIWQSSLYSGQVVTFEALAEHGIIRGVGDMPLAVGDSVNLGTTNPTYRYSNSNPTSTEESVPFVYSWEPWLDEYGELRPGGRANATILQIDIYVTPYISQIANVYEVDENTDTGMIIGTFEAISPNSSSEARSFEATISGSLGDSILGRLGYTLADIFKIDRRNQSGGRVIFNITVKNQALLDYERLVSNGSATYTATINVTASYPYGSTFSGTTRIKVINVDEPSLGTCLISVNGKLLRPANYAGFILKVNR